MLSEKSMSNFKTMIYFVLLLWFTNTKWTTAVHLGKCPRNLSMSDFNITRFAGEWFEVERSFYLMEIASGCTTLNFTLNDKGSLDVIASTINRWTNSEGTKSGIAIPITTGSSVLRFKFKTRMPFSLARFLPGAGIYHILYTDFDNVAILWTCNNYAMIHSDRFWILGRTREISAGMRINIYNKIRELSLDPERLIISKNEYCAYEYN